MQSESQLSDVLSEFARTMLTDFPIQAILDRLVERIVDVLPITAAGVTLITSRLEPHYVAASNESALRFEKLQGELAEGPCVAAYETGELISVPDIRAERRFPIFGPRALEQGLRAVFTFPLRHRDDSLGALDLYRDTPGPLDARALAIAQTLADVVAAYLLNAQARADLRLSSERSREDALHDPLTGLPNRVLLVELLDQAVRRGRRSGRTAAILFADLDGFKQVNDTYGHGVGDELLIAIAERLGATLRPGDTLARLFGDEFVILCEDLDGPSPVETIATRIAGALAVPFVLSTTAVSMTASVGIAFAGRGDQLSEELLHEADTAMYQAKRKGGARHQVMDLREQHRTDLRTRLENDLRGAATRGELRAEYQPIVRTADGRITGVEALLRWAHPSRGLVPPTTVVPLAERSGLITEIGLWMLEQACPDRHRWQSLDQSDDLAMSVNVSAHQLMSPNFAATVAAVLDSTSTDPELVTLEVTESAFVRDSERALVVLKDLKDLGVKIALDDFGTGYSPLSNLKRFPIDIVKIDQSFIADLQDDVASHAIVNAVIALAHSLKMDVVAEGVETAVQRLELAELGCNYCQGFYFARPMSADDLDALMQHRVAGQNLHLPSLSTA
jgi:diguanylate cyclase (GGDEF)-like protein